MNLDALPCVISSMMRLASVTFSLILCLSCSGPLAPSSTPVESPPPAPAPIEATPLSAAPLAPPASRVKQARPVSPIPPVRAQCARPNLPPPATVPTQTVDAYAIMHGVPLGLDIFSPRASGPSPAVVLIHGGGWRAGERAHVHDMARMLTTLGFAAIAVDYRKTETETYRFPGAIADLRCAIRYLRIHSQELGIDPQRIGAVGFSAGGHLAALLATAPDAAGLDDGCPYEGTSPAIQSVVSYYGPYDLTRRQDFVRRARRLIDQVTEGPNAERSRLLSPVTHLDAGDPPVLLIHGERDRVVPARQARVMRAALRRHGVPNRLLVVPTGGHGFTLLTDSDAVLAAQCTTFAFLERTLGLGQN